MKEAYQTPAMEVILFEAEDIVTTSNDNSIDVGGEDAFESSGG